MALEAVAVVEECPVPPVICYLVTAPFPLSLVVCEVSHIQLLVSPNHLVPLEVVGLPCVVAVVVDQVEHHQPCSHSS